MNDTGSTEPDVEPGPQESNPPPRFMDSAERRTEEGENGPGFADSASELSDEDLFFPRESSETEARCLSPHLKRRPTRSPSPGMSRKSRRESEMGDYEPEPLEESEEEGGFAEDRRERPGRPRAGATGFLAEAGAVVRAVRASAGRSHSSKTFSAAVRKSSCKSSKKASGPKVPL